MKILLSGPQRGSKQAGGGRHSQGEASSNSLDQFSDLHWF